MNIIQRSRPCLEHHLGIRKTIQISEGITAKSVAAPWCFSGLASVLHAPSYPRVVGAHLTRRAREIIKQSSACTPRHITVWGHSKGRRRSGGDSYDTSVKGFRVHYERPVMELSGRPERADLQMSIFALWFPHHKKGDG